MHGIRAGRGFSRVGTFPALLLLLAVLAMTPAWAWGQVPQTIAFKQQPPPQAYAGTAVVLGATATSGLPVSFSVASGPAQISGVNGTTLTYTGVGTVVVQANQAGGNGYSPAPSVQAPAITVQLLTKPVGFVIDEVPTVMTFSAAGTLANSSGVTQGAAGLDFRYELRVYLGPPNCTVGITYNVGDTCIAHFDFQPTRPGIRYGGITLSDASGNLLANSYIYAYGVGPQVLYAPIVQTLVGSSLGNPTGVAINGNGDLFVSNSVGPGLTEIAANGTVTPIGNLTNGKDVAVDGSGNVFLLTFDTLYEVMAVNGALPATPVVRTLATGFTVNGGGLAIDGSGNAYIADSPGRLISGNAGLIYEVYAVGGIIPSLSPKQIIGLTFAEPTGVAVDSAGNVYVSDGAASTIFEMLAVNGRVPPSPVVLSLGSGFVAPSNVRLDDTNDIFVSDSGLPGVLELQAVNGVVSPQTKAKSLGKGFISPQGLLVDDAGNVFVADAGYAQVIKLNYSSVPTLTFQPTLVGQTSADSAQAVTYTNAGNADLVFSVPATGSNPAITRDFTLGAASTCPQLATGGASTTLPVGQSCTNLVSFTPSMAGPESGTLTTVDNNLSVANAAQVVQLNGTGTLQTPVIQFTVGNHFVDDPPFSVVATSTSSAPLTYSIASGPATLAGSTVSLAGVVGNVTVQASQAAIGTYTAATQTATFSVSKHTQTINFVQPRSPVSLTVGSLPLVASASSGLPVSFSVLSGPASVSGGTLTFLGAGTVVVAADQAGNATIAPAAEVTRTLIVSAVTVALTAAPNPVFVQNPVVLTATLAPIGGTPTGSITFLDAGKPLAIAPLSGLTAAVSLTTLALGNHPITALYGGDGNFPVTTSPVQNVLVQDFTLTVANPDVVIFHGGTATYTLQLGPLGGAGTAAAVAFAVSGAPDHSTVTFTPQSVPAGSASTPVTLVIATPNYPVGPYNTAFSRTPFARTQMPLLAAALGMLGLPLWRRGRRLAKRSRLLDAAVALGVLLLSSSLLLGCGSGWRTQKYGLTITATSGQLQRSVPITLTTECKDLEVACPVE